MINGEKELVEMLDCVRDIQKDLITFKRLKAELNKSLMNDTIKELFGEHRTAYLYRGAAISDIANTDMLDVCDVENMDDVRKLFRDIENDIMAFQKVKEES
ncbi:hypothetical protein [uncultured Dialister sp.]|uniref:hypothetical protein n=1 Tax=Dialister succinatiphilus TaxID=487173 RepID=UPI00266F48B5|nr:hypothetical protein [uncultured Dialister sp.]